MIQTATIQSASVTISDMEIEIDPKDQAEKTHVIPPEYAKVILPGHVPEITQGEFGLLISQWLFTFEYSICVCHFDFKRAVALKLKISEPCTTFFWAVKNSPVIVRKRFLFSKRIKVEEKKVVPLRFDKASEDHRVEYKKGSYISLHITIPDQFLHVIKNEKKLLEILRIYDSIIFKPERT